MYTVWSSYIIHTTLAPYNTNTDNSCAYTVLSSCCNPFLSCHVVCNAVLLYVISYVLTVVSLAVVGATAPPHLMNYLTMFHSNMLLLTVYVSVKLSTFTYTTVHVQCRLSWFSSKAVIRPQLPYGIQQPLCRKIVESPWYHSGLLIGGFFLCRQWI